MLTSTSPDHATTPSGDPDLLIKQVNALIDAGATFAAAMASALDLPTFTRMQARRAAGWNVCNEVSIDVHGGARLNLTLTSPDGATREHLSQVAVDVSGLH